jgi:hypothetical protein
MTKPHESTPLPESAVATCQLPVEVSFSGRPRSTWLARFAVLYLDRSLHRCRDRIRRAWVRVRDVNGRRHGIDQLCSLELRLVDGATLHLSDLAESPQLGLRRLSQRARRLLLERRRRTW